jgi:hypothetical protein
VGSSGRPCACTHHNSTTRCPPTRMYFHTCANISRQIHEMRVCTRSLVVFLYVQFEWTRGGHTCMHSILCEHSYIKMCSYCSNWSTCAVSAHFTSHERPDFCRNTSLRAYVRVCVDRFEIGACIDCLSAHCTARCISERECVYSCSVKVHL